MSKQKQSAAETIELKQRKGTWKRFVKLILKCRLPWVWLSAYVILELGILDLGVSETDKMAELFAGNTSATLLTQLIGILLLNLVGTNLLIFVRQVTSARINRNMRTIVQDKLLRLPMSFFKDEEPREAVYRITGNAVVVDNTLMYFFLPIVMASYKSVKIFLKVFSYDWRLSIIMLAFLFGRINYSLNRSDSKLSARLIQSLSEMVTNIPLAKSFAKEDKEAAKGKALSDQLYRLSIRSGWLDQLRGGAESIISLLQTILMVAVALVLLRTGEIAKRTWITFFMFSGTFSGAVYELMTYWNNVKTIQGGAERLAEIMNAEEENYAGEPCEALRGDLALERATFRYDEEKTVLDEISCTFADGQVTALLGVSGCGKTTVTHLLTRLYRPESGRVTVGGKDAAGLALEDYRKQFAVVSQSGMLFSGTVRENVCYGTEGVTEEQLTDALKRAGAYDFVSSLPEGVNTRLEEYGGNLSGGQRQRLCMARALLSDAHYLILDEPVASMDAIAVSQLLEVLKEVTKDRCSIIIAHSAAVLELADRVVVIENGKTAAQGTVSEVRENSEFLRAMMGKKVSR